jgi:CubicO group peptidase (beta-lactamase class C family)
MKLFKLILTTTILLAGIPVSAQDPVRIDVKSGPMAEAVNDDLLRRAKAGFNGAIVVEKDGKVVLKAGYGWANRDTKLPFSTATIAQVGSLTKQFTAAAIVELSLKRKLYLTDEISKYLNGVPLASRSITIHQLLTHTAGLVENCGRDFDRITRSEMISRCLTNVKPHGQFLYSNLGYSVLAAIVESVTHKSLDNYLSEHFFKPLKMASTGYFFPNSLRGMMAVGYTAMGSNPPISDQLKLMGDAFWNLKGNGGIQASVDDMYVWYRALSEGPIISKEMRTTLLTPYVMRDDGIKHGYGWFIRERPDRQERSDGGKEVTRKESIAGQIEQVSHTGSDGVFLSVFVWRPIDRSFFYLVTNNRDKAGADMARTILEVVKTGGPPTKP